MKKISLIALLLLIVTMVSGCGKPLVKEELVIDNEKLVGYLINDSRCVTENCNSTFVEGIKSSLKQLFPTVEFIEYDYSSDLGGQFYEKYELTVLPALLFTKKIEAEGNYSRIQNYLTAKNDLFDLKLGATFNPVTGLHSMEFCDNQIDDDGNNLIDCTDPTCANSLICREEVPNKLDLFVMSKCPYGTKALDAMKEVLENFGDSIDFNVHYIASENTDGTFNSLHGQSEVDENIRELCAMKYYSEDYKYMEYIWCRDADLTADWEECTNDFSEVITCFEGEEGKNLLKEDIKLANELQIGSSPTWIANDRYQFSGIDAETVRKNICQYNPSLGEACGNELSATTTPAAACN